MLSKKVDAPISRASMSPTASGQSTGSPLSGKIVSVEHASFGMETQFCVKAPSLTQPSKYEFEVEPSTRLTLPPFSILDPNDENIDPNDLEPPSEDFISNFMLGHTGFEQMIGLKTIFKYDDGCFQANFKHNSFFAAALFPTKHSNAHLPKCHNVTTQTRKDFLRNPLLRQIHRLLAQQALLCFGLQFDEKSLDVQSHSSLYLEPLNWLKPEGQNQRILLKQIIESLRLLGNLNLAKNLCHMAATLFRYHDLDEEAVAFYRLEARVIENIQQQEQAMVINSEQFSPFVDALVNKTEPKAQGITSKIEAEKEIQKQKLYAAKRVIQAAHVLTRSRKQHLALRQEKQNALSLLPKEEQEKSLDNTQFIYTYPQNHQQAGQELNFYFNQHQFLGKINFATDKPKVVKSGKYKKVEFKNRNAVYFSVIQEENSPSLLTDERLREINRSSQSLSSYSHIYPAFYLDNQHLISRLAGSCNGNAIIERKISIPVSSFKGALEDLEKCYAKQIFVQDISPGNLMVKNIAKKHQDGKKAYSPAVYEVNIIDVESDIIDTAKRVKNSVFSIVSKKGYFHPRLHDLFCNGRATAFDGEGLRGYLKQHNNFNFLLSMFFMTSQYSTNTHADKVMEIAGFDDAMMNWLKKVIKPSHLLMVETFVKNPRDVAEFNLSDAINWEAKV